MGTKAKRVDYQELYRTLHWASGFVEDGVQLALEQFEPLNSAQEGYAFLLQRVDELWAMIKEDQPLVSLKPMIRLKAGQVAVQALRIIVDITGRPVPE